MVHPDGPGHRKKGSVLPVGEQHSRSLDPARWFRPRPRHRSQPGHLLLTQRQLDRLPPPRHDLNPRLRIKAARLQPMSAKMNLPPYDAFQRIDELVPSPYLTRDRPTAFGEQINAVLSAGSN